MAKPKTKNTKNSRRASVPNASKDQAYEALSAFNRDVEQVLADLERLGALGILPEREQRRFLKICRATLRETRAWTNFDRCPPPAGRTGLGAFARIRQREDAR